mmetsp:Transcript_5728/g.6802  ORF Transcript_5728/g.6802 Transcript_5728/m.6802 type:complete len:102 (+) Transcript_5728:750-1055(+)
MYHYAFKIDQLLFSSKAGEVLVYAMLFSTAGGAESSRVTLILLSIETPSSIILIGKLLVAKELVLDCLNTFVAEQNPNEDFTITATPLGIEIFMLLINKEA